MGTDRGRGLEQLAGQDRSDRQRLLLELRLASPLHLPRGRMKEAVLEPLLRRMRIARVLPHVKEMRDCRLLDIGCGWEARLLRELEPHIAYGWGIDFKAPAILTPKLRTIAGRIDDRLPFEDESFDVITMLAVLEHLERPAAVLREIERLLRPGG